MQYILFVLLVLLIAYLAVLLRKKEAGLSEIQIRLHELQPQTEQAAKTADETDAMKDEMRDQINTIHLYALLSEEESHSASVKEKQKEIIRLSEEILHRIDE